MPSTGCLPHRTKASAGPRHIQARQTDARTQDERGEDKEAPRLHNALGRRRPLLRRPRRIRIVCLLSVLSTHPDRLTRGHRLRPAGAPVGPVASPSSPWCPASQKQSLVLSRPTWYIYAYDFQRIEANGSRFRTRTTKVAVGHCTLVKALGRPYRLSRRPQRVRIVTSSPRIRIAPSGGAGLTLPAPPPAPSRTTRDARPGLGIGLATARARDCNHDRHGPRRRSQVVRRARPAR
jgi:hypothetical protein